MADQQNLTKCSGCGGYFDSESWAKHVSVSCGKAPVELNERDAVLALLSCDRSSASAIYAKLKKMGLAICKLSLFLLFISCGSGGSVERIFSRGPLIGYGPSDSWFMQPIGDYRDYRDLVRHYKENGLTLIGIEWVPSLQNRTECWCHQSDGRCGALGTFPAAASSLVDEAWSSGVSTLVTINWNECAVRQQPLEWFKEQYEIIRTLGEDRIILMPISEPEWDRKARQITEMARTLWRGRFAVAPQHTDIPHDFVDYHPCTEEQARELIEWQDPTVLVNTDCPFRDWREDVFERLTREAKNAFVPLHFYADRYTGPHKPFVEAIGRGLKEP